MAIPFDPSAPAKSTDTLQVEMVRRVADNAIIEVVTWLPTQTEGEIHSWRKPDVSTEWNGKRIVFEAQVSNTYPQIVAERTDFYRKQGALLIWIYDRLNDSEWRTLHADTFCSNGQHLFIVDDECVAISEKTKQAHFKIYTQYPEVTPVLRQIDSRWGLEIVQEENTSLIPFSSLTLDIESQTAVYFEINQKQRAANHKVLCAKAQADFSHDALVKSIQELIGQNHPIQRSTLEGWAALICGIESKRLEKPIGTKLEKPIGVLNLVYDHHPQFLHHLIETLDRLNLDPPNNRYGAWKNRVDDFYNGRYQNGPLPESHKPSFKLLRYIYP